MSSTRKFKDTIYDQFARIGKAVSSPTRLELIDLLCQGPRTVETLAEESAHSLANTSHHLQILRFNRLVEAEKDGLFVTYRLANEEVCEFFGSLQRLAESRLAEIKQTTEEFLGNQEAMESVDRAGLLRRVQEGEVTVIDVRPPEEYRAGHIPGAVSVPLPDLEEKLVELPRSGEIVAYCRGPYCVLAVEAVELLCEHGFKATRLAEGIPEWKASGFDIALGEESNR